jgi:hypothetical protein
MSSIYLPRTFTKATRSMVVVPAPDDVGGLFDPSNGRTVIPATVEMIMEWTYGTEYGDRCYAMVHVTGPRLLKSGDTGQPITSVGWEDRAIEGRHGVAYRPQWLTDLIDAHLPAILDLTPSPWSAKAGELR